MKHCKKCKKPIPKDKDPRNIYCSQMCANRATTETLIKARFCRSCGVKVGRTQGGNYQKKCADCINKSLIENKTINQVLGIGANRFNKIRHHARSIMEKSNILRACTQCGYDKHVEVCHIKPISSFTESTLISVINSLENLIYLCPNHHWEHDNPKS